MALPSEFRLDVVTPQGLALRSKATSVIAPGTEGYLGVLPGHTPLVSSLRAGKLTFVTAGRRGQFIIGPGYIEITPTSVIVITEEVRAESQV